MFKFFKRRKRSFAGTADTQVKTAPGTEISYDPELIGQLMEDHRDLLELFGNIHSSFTKGEYRKTAKYLSEFRSALQSHLLTENIRLYVYLEHSLANDDLSYDLMRDLRREMEGIGRTAMSFLKKYETTGIDQDLAEHFSKDLETVGTVLAQRIQKEEKVLYPLYMPHY